MEIKAKIETLFDVLRVNNFFETISPTGFRDINIEINFQDFTVEILILLKDIYLLETSETRKNYDKMKTLIERDDSDIFKDEILKIKEYNFKLFNKVIEDYNNKTLGIKLPLWDIKQIYN